MMSPRKKERKQQVTLFSRLEPYLFLLPFVIPLLIFTVYPFINIFIMSMKQDYHALSGAYDGIGFDNFRFIWDDRDFRAAITNTTRYVIGVVPLTTIISIFFAVLLNSKIKFKGFFQTAFFLPMVTSVVAVGLVWRWFYNFDFGLFNFMLGVVGVDPVRWLARPESAMTALIIYGIWSNLPFTIILLLSGLQSVNPQYAVAAKVDGAKDFLIFWKVTLPLLAPTVVLTVILNVISSSRVFTELMPLFSGRPGPARSLYTMVFYIYDAFYVRWRFGPAAAAAVVLFFAVFAFTMLQLLVARRYKHY